MCSVDFEQCQVWSEQPHRARKPRRCGGCGLPIEVGAPYLAHFSVLDGDPTREAMCFGCWAARQQFCEAHGQFFTPSALIETLRECVGGNDDPEDEWRPVLASVLARHRRSPAWRKHIAVAAGGAP